MTIPYTADYHYNTLETCRDLEQLLYFKRVISNLGKYRLMNG